MSHEIETRNNRAQMFSGSGQTPWHRLGQVIPGTATSGEALELSGLDWNVRCEPIQLENPEWKGLGLDRFRAVIREDDGTALGVVGKGWKPLQNRDTLAIGDALCENGARWETAGSMMGGRRVWALMRLDEDANGVEVISGDPIKSYLLFGNGHDGGAAVFVGLTTVRVVCNNTFQAAITERQPFIRIRHTSGVMERTLQAADIISSVKNSRDRFITAAQSMATVELSELEQLDYLMKALNITQDPRKRSTKMQNKLEVARACLALERNQTAPNSVWAVFNAVTDFATHEDRAGRAKADTEGRAASLSMGTLSDLNAKAFKMATTLVAARS